MEPLASASIITEKGNFKEGFVLHCKKGESIFRPLGVAAGFVGVVKLAQL
jgi:hypothetical protein